MGDAADMKERYTVSELAKLFGISSQTLRYYDKIGLFQPDYIDESNNYRYYSYEQFFRLSMIIQLKRLDFSLEGVRRYSSSMDVRSLEQNLLEQKGLIRRQIEQLMQLEAKNDHILKNLQIAKNAADHQDCEVVAEPPRWQYAVPVNFEIKDLYRYIKIVYESYIHSSMAAHFTQHSEIVLQIDRENLMQRNFRTYNSIGFFLDEETGRASPGRGVSRIEGGLFASCIHFGSYDTIHRSYQRLYDHIEKQGLTVSGDSLEFAIVSISLTKNPENFITQIQIPVTKNE